MTARVESSRLASATACPTSPTRWRCMALSRSGRLRATVRTPSPSSSLVTVSYVKSLATVRSYRDGLDGGVEVGEGECDGVGEVAPLDWFARPDVEPGDLLQCGEDILAPVNFPR